MLNKKKTNFYYFLYFFIKENIPDLIVWTSQMQRTIQTAAKINAPKEQWKALNEINAVKIKKYKIIISI
jgi:broad specificity phosphatase PhoE